MVFTSPFNLDDIFHSSRVWGHSKQVHIAAFSGTSCGRMEIETGSLSASSANLPVTSSCLVWSPCSREGTQSRETLTGLRGGPEQTSWSSTRPSARSCTWVRAIPSTNTGWVGNGLKAALSRRTLGCWLIRVSTWPGNMCLSLQDQPKQVYDSMNKPWIKSGKMRPTLCLLQ